MISEVFWASFSWLTLTSDRCDATDLALVVEQSADPVGHRVVLVDPVQLE
jgi:hypothetical protein